MATNVAGRSSSSTGVVSDSVVVVVVVEVVGAWVVGAAVDVVAAVVLGLVEGLTEQNASKPDQHAFQRLSQYLQLHQDAHQAPVPRVMGQHADDLVRP